PARGSAAYLVFLVSPLELIGIPHDGDHPNYASGGNGGDLRPASIELPNERGRVRGTNSCTVSGRAAADTLRQTAIEGARTPQSGNGSGRRVLRIRRPPDGSDCVTCARRPSPGQLWDPP